MTLPSFDLPMNVVSRKRLAFLCTGILVVVVALLAGWAGREGLFAVPAKNNQHFTELYFTDTKAIPPRLENNRRYSIPFAIVNREAGEQTYSYQTHISEGAVTQVSAPQTVTLQPGERVIRTAQFLVKDAAQPLKVSVELVNKQQIITFRIPQ